MSPGSGPRAAAVALVLAGVQFLAVLDGLAVSLALPQIRAELHLGAAGLAWVLNATSVALAGGLLVAGRLSDLLGRRPLFLAGLALLALGSLVSGAAPTAGVLHLGRVLIGLGAALSYPSALSFVNALFPDEPWRSRAFAMSAVAGASGSLAGAVYGGVVTGLVGWRWVFWLTIPFTVALFVAARRLLPATPPDRRGRPLDLTGAALATLAVTSLVTAVLGAGEGTTSRGLVLGSGAVSVVSVVILVVHERRIPDPLLPARVLRSRRLLAGCCGIAASSALWSVVTFVLSQELQADGATPGEAGLALLPASAGIVVTGTLVIPRLRRRFGSLWVAVVGLVLGVGAAAAFVGFDGLPYQLGLLPSLLVMGAALSAVHTGLLEHALRHGPSGAEGVSAAVFESSTHVGGAVSVAVYATLLGGVGFDAAYVAAAVFGVAGLAGVRVAASRRSPVTSRGAPGTAATVQARWRP